MKESAIWFLAGNGQMYKMKCTHKNYESNSKTSFFSKTGKTDTLKNSEDLQKIKFFTGKTT